MRRLKRAIPLARYPEGVMTEQEFKERYAADSGMTVDEVFRPTGLVAMRCYCGRGGCEGWAAVQNSVFARKNHTKLYGPNGVVTQKLRTT